MTENSKCRTARRRSTISKRKPARRACLRAGCGSSGMPTPRRPQAPILIVEDKASLRAMLRPPLEEQGHSVVEAADEAEALRQVRDTRPDLVLSDLRLLSCDRGGGLPRAADSA